MNTQKTELEALKQWAFGRIHEECDDRNLVIRNKSVWASDEIYNLSTDGGWIKVDFRRFYNMQKAGVDAEALLGDILLELKQKPVRDEDEFYEEDEDEDCEEEAEDGYDRAWVLRNYVFRVMNENDIVKNRDEVYWKIGDTGLVLGAVSRYNRRTVIGTSFLKNYQIEKDEMFEACKRNLLAEPEPVLGQDTLDGGIHVEDARAFLGEYLEERFGKQKLYLSAWYEKAVKVYTETTKHGLSFERPEPDGIFNRLDGVKETSLKLSSCLIIYQNGVYNTAVKHEF